MRSAPPSARPKPASNPRSAASATAEPVLGRAKPDPWDQALAETRIGRFKTAVIRRRGSWRSAEAVEFAPPEWGDGFTPRRRLEPLGNIPPAEARYYAQIAAQAGAA